MICCREFIMKDAYSFDLDEVGLEKSYLSIFHRAGLTIDSVLADSSGYVANSEKLESIIPKRVVKLE